ncbi:MAG: hypothetical protein AABY95_08470 [Pseudomonadota bacterium]
MDNLDERLGRIYSALDATVQHDLSQYRAEAHRPSPNVLIIGVDFRKGMSPEQLSNAAHSVIHNIAHLVDHLKKHLRSRGRGTDAADNVVKNSREVQLLIDLSNNDKHGYPPRDGGKSGCSPKLVDLRKTLRLSATGTKISIPMSGAAPTVSGGQAPVVITGRIVDKDGKDVAGLQSTIETAIRVWEEALRREGVIE